MELEDHEIPEWDEEQKRSVKRRIGDLKVVRRESIEDSVYGVSPLTALFEQSPDWEYDPYHDIWKRV